MGTPITHSQDFFHPSLGKVHMIIRMNSRRISAGWKNGVIHLNVPYGADSDTVIDALNHFAPNLLNSKSKLRYHDLQELHFDGLSIKIIRQSIDPESVLGQVRPNQSIISVGSKLKFNDDSTTRSISNIMCRIAKRVAPQILIPRAEELAHSIGVKPSGWDISTGHTIMGRCDSKGFILLSYMLVFVPQHLRDYIVCHELAHLTEMNHSPRFHQLCNQYCNGREAQLIKEMKEFKWPVLR